MYRNYSDMRARKVDKTQAEIVKALRYCGYQVLLINGVIDAIATARGKVWLLDFKSEGGRLTQKQQELVDAGWPILFPKSPQEALQMVSP